MMTHMNSNYILPRFCGLCCCLLVSFAAKVDENGVLMVSCVPDHDHDDGGYYDHDDDSMIMITVMMLLIMMMIAMTTLTTYSTSFQVKFKGTNPYLESGFALNEHLSESLDFLSPKSTRSHNRFNPETGGFLYPLADPKRLAVSNSKCVVITNGRFWGAFPRYIRTRSYSIMTQDRCS